MKACILTASMNHGGASVVAFDIARGMVQRGHEVLFVSSGKSSIRKCQDGYELRVLKNQKTNLMFHYLNPFLMLKFNEQLRKFKPDIIHVHNINLQTFSLGVLLFSRYYPMIWTLHDVWALCMTGWPKIADCNGMLNKCRKCPTWPKWMVQLNKFLKESVYKFSKIHIVSPSHWLVSLLKKSVLHQHPVSVIHNGIDPARFFSVENSSIRSKLNIAQDKKVILFCGGKKLAGQFPAWRKGWAYLCEALEILKDKHNNLHLLYVGDPLNLPENFPVTVTFAKGESRNDMNIYFNASDMLVLPTLADHPALTVLEAMACKIPIIATSAGGIPEAVIPQETGLLCASRDSVSLAEKIDYLVLNPAQGHKMAMLAYQRFNEMFTFDRMIDQYEDVYHQMISSFHEKQ